MASVELWLGHFLLHEVATGTTKATMVHGIYRNRRWTMGPGFAIALQRKQPQAVERVA